MGNKIRELRQARGMTMKRLGELVGVSESAISQYEAGKRSPDSETLLKFGKIFNVSIEYILTGKDSLSPETNGQRVSDEDIMFALFGGAGEITEEDFDEVRRFAAFIAERKKQDSQN